MATSVRAADHSLLIPILNGEGSYKAVKVEDLYRSSLIKECALLGIGRNELGSLVGIGFFEVATDSAAFKQDKTIIILEVGSLSDVE